MNESRCRAIAREYAIARESRRYLRSPEAPMSGPSYFLDEFIRRIRLRWSAERRATLPPCVLSPFVAGSSEPVAVLHSATGSYQP